MDPSSDNAPLSGTRLPWSVPPAKSSRLNFGQRLNIACLRALRWEFWPAWLFYLPIVVHIVWLGIRHRSPTLFTAVNPIMEAGGVVGEQKHVVLKALQDRLPSMVADTILLSGDFAARTRQAEAFAERVGYPVVLKPDIGQRGRGVFVARHAADMCGYLQQFVDDVIAQRYIDGEEYGVFVARKPGEPSPRILSIVQKTFPFVTGNGHSRVAELILADERAKLSAGTFFETLGERLDDVLAVGETLKLVELGSHCRGSLFLNAGDKNTSALVSTLTKLMDAIPDFDFGRIDLRVSTGGRLESGTGIKVMELNGVTSESAHIYHPGTPLLVGYRAMFRQWSEAFLVGAERVKRGGQTTSPFKLLRQFRADLRRGRGWF